MNKFTAIVCSLLFTFNLFSQNTNFTNRANFEASFNCNSMLQETFTSFTNGQPVTQFLNGLVQVNSSAQIVNLGTLGPDVIGNCLLHASFYPTKDINFTFSRPVYGFGAGVFDDAPPSSSTVITLIVKTSLGNTYQLPVNNVAKRYVGFMGMTNTEGIVSATFSTNGNYAFELDNIDVLVDFPDFDGDGFAVCQGDCNDNNATIKPNAIELCDGIDNNCNGQIDEGISPPVVSITLSSTNVCAGQLYRQTISFSGSASPIVSFTINGGDPIPANRVSSVAIQTAPQSSTNIVIVATDINGCTGSASAFLTVRPSPQVTVSDNTVLCAGQSTTLTATPVGSELYTYKWNNLNETTPSITVSPLTTRNYTVTVTLGTCSITRTVVVSVLSPTADITGNLEICEGLSTTLIATGGETYLWSTGATTDAITVTPSVSTGYTVTATDENGCIATSTITVTVNPNPTATITGTTTICSGSSTTLTASGGSTYLWNTGATTNQITVTPSVSTTYSVSITDANGCTNSKSQLVTVNPIPLPPSVLNRIFCQNSIATPISATGSNLKWYTTATGGTGGTTAPTPSTTTVGITNYYVTQTVNGCESPRAIIQVTIKVCGTDTDCDGVLDANDVCQGGNDKIDSNNDGKPDCRYFTTVNNIIAAWRCGSSNEKVVMCHIDQTNPSIRQTICVSANAVAAHLAHGDYIGTCGNSKCTNSLIDNGLLSLFATAEPQRTHITWLSNLGYKTDYYTIQKQNNASGVFEDVTTINNTYFDNQMQFFSNYDNQPTEGDNPYRLKAVFNDGRFTLSETVKVRFDKIHQVKVFPNPVDNQLDILLNEVSDEITTVKLFNILGVEMKRQILGKNNTQLQMDVKDLPVGFYQVHILQKGKRDFIQQVIIQR